MGEGPDVGDGHWIGFVGENLHRKPMGFYHQIDRVFLYIFPSSNSMNVGMLGFKPPTSSWMIYHGKSHRKIWGIPYNSFLVFFWGVLGANLDWDFVGNIFLTWEYDLMEKCDVEYYDMGISMG